MSTTDDKSFEIQLPTPAQYLPGVGPQRAAKYEKIGIYTARDLLFQFPRDYQDMSQMHTTQTLEEGELGSIIGVIEEIDIRKTQNNRTMLAMLIRTEGDYIRGMWFNQPYVADKFKESERVLVSGTPKRQGMRWEFVHPRLRHLDDDEEAAGQILPVYSLTEGLKQSDRRRAAKPVVEALASQVEDVLPAEFRERYQLCGIEQAIRKIHLPTDQDELAAARRRFVFQELLVQQIALAFRRAQQSTRGAVSLPCDARLDARIRKLFPFKLTSGQDRVIRDIVADMDARCRSR